MLSNRNKRRAVIDRAYKGIELLAKKQEVTDFLHKRSKKSTRGVSLHAPFVATSSFPDDVPIVQFSAQSRLPQELSWLDPNDSCECWARSLPASFRDGPPRRMRQSR